MLVVIGNSYAVFVCFRFLKMRLSTKERQILRGGVKNYLVQHPFAKKSEVVSYFQEQGYSRSTVYNAVLRHYQGLGIQDKERTGRPRKLTRGKVTKLVKQASDTVGCSLRKLSRSFHVCPATVRSNLLREGLRYHKRQAVPKYSETQIATVPSLCRKLLQKHIPIGTSVLMDDEKYFSYTADETPGNAGFYTKNKATCPTDVKYKQKSKFSPKVLMLIALSDHLPAIFPAHLLSVPDKRYLSLRMFAEKTFAFHCQVSFRQPVHILA